MDKLGGASAHSRPNWGDTGARLGLDEHMAESVQIAAITETFGPKTTPLTGFREAFFFYSGPAPHPASLYAATPASPLD